MPVTKNTLRYTYSDALGEKKSKSYASISASVTNANAQALGAALVANDIYAGGITDVLKIEKISTTTTEIPVA